MDASREILGRTSRADKRDEPDALTHSDHRLGQEGATGTRRSIRHCLLLQHFATKRKTLSTTDASADVPRTISLLLWNIIRHKGGLIIGMHIIDVCRQSLGNFMRIIHLNRHSGQVIMNIIGIC